MPEGPRRFEGGFLSLPGKDDRIGMPSKGRLIAGPGARIRTTQDGRPASRHWFDCKLSTTVACVRRRTDVDMSPCHTGPVTEESRAEGDRSSKGPAREPVKRRIKPGTSKGPAVKRTGQSQGVKGHGIPGVASVESESPVPGSSPAEMHRRRMCVVWSLLCVLGMAFRHPSARPRRHGFGIVWGLIVPGPSTDATGLNAAFARLVWVQLWQGLDLTLKVSLTGSRTRSLPSSSRQHVPLGLPGQVIRRQSQSQSSRYYVACQSDP
ncbi:hypothetical protein EDB80DRAFT_688659 [Ilyonectria destructans]|nr:hypothetical protein EDB80DRAFT_688659 [Ilyonectria destructans]